MGFLSIHSGLPSVKGSKKTMVEIHEPGMAFKSISAIPIPFPS
jgi:hypothetical protein